MKIAEIQTGPTPQINTIRSAFGRQSGSVLVEQFNIARLQPLSSIFIRAVVNSNVLTEADSNLLLQLFRSGIAKLKAAMTPGTSEDLELLLTMMAPQGGGVKRVEELLNVAKQSPIHDNEDWWNTFFEAFNIQDDLVKQDIRDRVSTEVPAAKPAKPQVPGGDDVGGNKFQDFIDRLSSLQQRQDQNKARADEIRARMAELQGQAQSEETEAVISGILCEVSSVRRNFGIISNLMHAEMRSICEGKLPTFDNKVLFGLLSEGLLDDFRTAFANRNYAKAENERSAQRYGQQADLADGERVAKLAVNVAKNHLRQKFNAALQDAGLLPNDIIKSYATWKKLAQIPHKSQEQLAQYQIATKKLKQAMDLFQPMMPNPPQQDPNDPLDPGDPPESSTEPEIVDDVEVVRPGPEQKEKPFEIGFDETEEDFQRKEQMRQIAIKVASKMVRRALRAKQTGGDVNYTVRSYLTQVYKTISPELAEYLWKTWKRSTGYNGEDLG